MKRTTILLPDQLYEQLRLEAFRNRVSMGQVIRARLERTPPARKPRKWRVDPLRAVEGIGSDGKLAEGIDEALYGI